MEVVARFLLGHLRRLLGCCYGDHGGCCGVC